MSKAVTLAYIFFKCVFLLTCDSIHIYTLFIQIPTRKTVQNPQIFTLFKEFEYFFLANI